MTLRMPNPYRTYQSLLDFQRSKERMSVLSEQITRDKRITRLSDDPTAAALIMDFETSIERNRMYVKQGESAASFLKGTESALHSIGVQIDRLLELGEQGLSDIIGDKGRNAIGVEVDAIFTIILDLSNTKEQGKYLFAGTKTTTQPFTAPPLPAVIPPGGTLQGADPYAGNTVNIDLDVSPVSAVTTNLSGEWVFLGDGVTANQDLFMAVRKLSDGLKLDDRALISDAFNEIREIKNRINVCLTNIGARQLALENTATNLEDFNETLQSIQNTYEAVDYPWTISQFSAEQAAQQASLSIIAKMGRYSLFDYIG